MTATTEGSSENVTTPLPSVGDSPVVDASPLPPAGAASVPAAAAPRGSWHNPAVFIGAALVAALLISSVSFGAGWGARSLTYRLAGPRGIASAQMPGGGYGERGLTPRGFGHELPNGYSEGGCPGQQSTGEELQFDRDVPNGFHQRGPGSGWGQ